MRQETVHYFTEKEEEFAHLLTKIGMMRNVATVLVFLANVPEATSHAIERGTGLRQPEVSLAAKYLIDKGWIKSREDSSPNKGRRKKIYGLAKPVTEIMNTIGMEKREEAKDRLARIRRLQDYLP